MKAVYTLFISAGLLTTVACSNLNTSQESEDVVIVQESPAAQSDVAGISLDSFQRSSVYTLPQFTAVREEKLPGSSYAIHREKDAVTLSGAVYVKHEGADHLISHHSYRFYFRASGKNSYAYLNYSKHFTAPDSRASKYIVREAAYHFDFAALAG